ncbi:MAG TPA: alpha/beta fold hydrolase [Candidatus Thermoplasmatota archaeon]|nr:alpha/beta fold hydrolase [Candidatus Thermoplasmatota archaeon]
MAQPNALIGMTVLLTALSACVTIDADPASTVAGPATLSAPLATDTALPGLEHRIQQTPLCFRVQNPSPSLPSPSTTYHLRGTLFHKGPARADAIAFVLLHGGGWEARSFMLNSEHPLPLTLADAGYAVITYDRLGQGDSRPATSGPAQGWAFLDHLDMLHQLIGHLRQGTATVMENDGCAASHERTPPFDRIVLSGLSLGGALVGHYAGAYGDVDAVIPMDWSNQGSNPALTAFIARSLTTIDQDGYAIFPTPGEDCRSLIFHEPGADPTLVNGTCGSPFRRTAASELTSLVEVTLQANAQVPNVPAKVAVLLTWADESFVFKPANDQLPDSRRAEYDYWKANCPCAEKVETWTQEKAGHAMHMHKTAPTWTTRVLEFLDTNGLAPAASGQEPQAVATRLPGTTAPSG